MKITTSRNAREGRYAGKAKTYLLLDDFSMKLIKWRHVRTKVECVSLKDNRK